MNPLDRLKAPLRRTLGKAQRSVRAELHAFSRDRPIVSGSVLYESFAGNGALCNPEAIFRELLRAPDMQHLTHIWVLDNLARHTEIQAEFASAPNVRFITRRTPAYFAALATSQYLINNSTFPADFSKRPGQTYVNTWHGTPLKLMGYDMPDGAAESANTLRNFLMADYLLSGGPFMTHRVYEEAYKLGGLYRGQVIEEGYPRMDHQWMTPADDTAARQRLEAAGIDLRGREIVLYAPTWKGTSFSNPANDARELLEASADLQSRLGDRFVVLLKTHQVVYELAQKTGGASHIVVPNDIPTNTVLGISSVLITDYSSIIVDYLPLNRPAFFFIPDAEQYADDRGTYFDLEDLPGAVFDSVSELARGILDAVGLPSPQYSPTQLAYFDQFVPFDDGGASARVVDIVFRGRTADRRLVSLSSSTRTSILLHLGGMRSNGITSSALNLLNAIDSSLFDVSVILQKPGGDDQRANQLRIPPHVRQFHRFGGMNGHKTTHTLRRVRNATTRAPRPTEPASLQTMWADEWERCFGDSTFDAVIDFSGYSPFWANLFSHSPDAIRSIWLHNDMESETRRVTRGRMRMRRSLPAVFATYSRFDSLISVSESLAEVNAKSLAARWNLEPEHFVAARNMVDASHVEQGLLEPLTSLEETEDASAGTWLNDLEHRDDLRWFVSVGRFSPEKNQERLLRSFAMIRDRHPEARLLVVGYGPLQSHLEHLVTHLGLTDAAFVVGPFSNPFPLLANADCFVLSSNYEGQPMVLLEAAIAGLPIVSVDFATVRDALPESHILVVDQDDAALAQGMEAFLRGEVEPAALDVDAYNAAAVREFHIATRTAELAQRTDTA
ncbi:glycosyltransferase [Glaciihabitans sp. dw_435]|uniref:glycosyltransferase n=1 Tax=Glaciihabitans sp. dw_435 TaxID=2720081 RepID=UPI0027DAD81B|nr:glycosyltransferase [Glaciihabitans sp. dw_435]